MTTKTTVDSTRSPGAICLGTLFLFVGLAMIESTVIYWWLGRRRK